MFTVYTKEGCVSCDNAKKLLTEKQEPFQAVKIGFDITLESFKMIYPQVKAVPFIINEDRVIGGMHELAKLLNK